jgi:hypothetical protein
MLAARNKRFRIGLGIATVAYLIATAGEIISANRLIGIDGEPGGYVIAAALIPATLLVGAGGWALAALAFDREIDWRRLRLAATILATSHLVYAAALIVDVATTVSLVDAGSYGTAEILTALGATLTGVAACFVAFAIAAERRGAVRVKWLRWAALFAVAGSLAIAAGQLALQSYYSDHEAVHRATIGVLVAAVGSFGLAAAALFFATRVDRPLGRREAGLAGAAVLAAASTLCIVGGEILIATIYDQTHDGAVIAPHWLGVIQRVFFVGLYVAVALGSRTAAEPPPDDALAAPEPVEA